MDSFFSIITWVYWGDVIGGFYMFYHLDLYILPVLPQGSPSEGGPSAGFRTKSARFHALVFCCKF